MESSPTPQELDERLTKAQEAVTVGSHYAHYRDPEKHYKVLSLALLESSLEPCVVYQAQYGDRLTWVRALNDWASTVSLDSGKKVDRFQKIP